MQYSREVAQALEDQRPVVALESTIISHGLPRPENLRVATQVESTVRARGATPATIAIVDGVVHIGLEAPDLTRLALDDNVVKTSVRDIAPTVASGATGATTVAATSHLAALAKITIFATGGLGGVHRQARESWDESADLVALSKTATTVICSGVKSVLDVAATLERLESLNVAVVGYQTHAFPGFYLTSTEHRIDWSVDDEHQVAQIIAARDAADVSSALIVANPLPPELQLDPDVHAQVLAEGIALARTRNIHGKAVTPFLLDHFHRQTHGASLVVNEHLIVRNADLAARIAVASVATARKQV